MIKCPNCGKEMPDGAKFCCFCASSMVNGDLADYSQNIEQKKKKSAKKKKFSRKKLLAIIIPVIAVLLAALMWFVIIPAVKYNKAEKLSKQGEYQAAIDIVNGLGKYHYNKDNWSFVKYNNALIHKENGDFHKAYHEFSFLKNYKDVTAQIEDLKKTEYINGEKYLKSGEKAKAAIAFGKADDYKDAKERSFALWDEIAVRETLSAGANHTVAVKENGTVVATGDNEYGQCDVESWKDIVAVCASGNWTVGLKSDGTLVETGSAWNDCEDITNWKDIVALSICVDLDSFIDRGCIIVLKSDGTILRSGRHSDNYECDCTMAAVSEYYAHELVGIGDECYEWTDVIAVYLSNNTTIGIKSDGTIIVESCAGIDKEDIKDFTGFTSGNIEVVAIKPSGKVYASDYYAYDDLLKWQDIVAIDANDDHVIGLKKDGTVVADEETTVGESVISAHHFGECEVSYWNDIVAVSTGVNHTVALRKDGTVVATDYIDFVTSDPMEEYAASMEGIKLGIKLTHSGQCDVSGWTNIKLPNNIKN